VPLSKLKFEDVLEDQFLYMCFEKVHMGGGGVHGVGLVVGLRVYV
jgi:hypothetical protein